MEIKVQALHRYRDIELKRIVRKNEPLTLNSKKRAEHLVALGHIKILSITKPEKQEPATTTKPDSEKTLKELRELYPDIKATSKKDFLSKI